MWTDTFVQEDTLTQNISTIRRALGDSTDSPHYVLTVPREGYRFVAPVEIVVSRESVEERKQDGAPAPSATIPAPGRIRQWFKYTAGLAVATAFAAVGLFSWKVLRQAANPAEPQVPAAFEVFEPEGTRFSTSGGGLALSPDGRTLAFLAADADGDDYLWIRPVDAVESTRLPGTPNASQPFWSSDSQSVAYFADGFLRCVDVSRGTPRTISRLGAQALAGTWNRDGVILFVTAGRGLFRVSASGGTPEPVEVLTEGNSRYCRWPSFLPDGHRFLFTVLPPAAAPGIYVGSLEGGTPRRLSHEISSSTFVPPGAVLHSSGGGLVFAPVDPQTLTPAGEPVPILDRVWLNPGTRRAVFSASQTGVLAFREPQTTHLRWIRRTGETISTSPAAIYRNFAVSRDGRVLTEELDHRLGTYDLWLRGPGWDSSSRLTFDPANDVRPVWSADQSRVVFSREGQNGWQLFDMSVDRPGEQRPLLSAPSPRPVAGLAWDGRVLEYSTFGPAEATVITQLRPGRADPPLRIAADHTSAAEGRVSPDRKWLAYTMNVTDSRVPQTALYIRPWPGGPGLSEISAAGSAPRWRGTGVSCSLWRPAAV